MVCFLFSANILYTSSASEVDEILTDSLQVLNGSRIRGIKETLFHSIYLSHISVKVSFTILDSTT